MERLNMTVLDFANHFLASDSKVRVVKASEVIFEGTLDGLYCSSTKVLSNIVAIIGAEESTVCLSCRK